MIKLAKINWCSFMEKLYKGHVYGSLTEIDENNKGNEIYFLVSFDEEPYNVWDCIHTQVSLTTITRLDESVTLLTKDIEEEIVTEIEKKTEEIKKKI